MKVLLINKFFFFKGGSERTFFETAGLLKNHGHEVQFFSMHHPQNIDSQYSQFFLSAVDFKRSQNLLNKLKSAGRMLYSCQAKKQLENLIRQEKPDIAHLHNIYHQISPSILHTLKKFHIPVVMTLHDYKLLCPVYTMFYKSRVCETCLGQNFYHCFFKKCCDSSYLSSILTTFEMYLHHYILNIYDLVDAFICPSIFLKEKIVGSTAYKEIYHLPNCIQADSILPSYTWEEKSLVYVGRLSHEKGLSTLLAAVKDLNIRVKIIGDGPIKEELIKKTSQEEIHNIEFLGYLPRQPLLAEIRKAMFVVLPSEWYENNPFAILEAFALGKPVIASHIGGIPELVQNEKTGFTFSPGSADDLRSKIQYLLANTHLLPALGRNARKLIEQHYCPKTYFHKLMQIYTSLGKHET